MFLGNATPGCRLFFPLELAFLTGVTRLMKHVVFPKRYSLDSQSDTECTLQQ
jgi:hypothetical protein